MNKGYIDKQESYYRKAAMQSRMSNTSDNVQNRNRRMFGNLLGHLNQAKNILTKDQSLFDRQVLFLIYKFCIEEDGARCC